MTQTTTNASPIQPRMDCARRRVAEATIPDYARRFPDQFEDAVVIVADMRERMGICTTGTCC
jgi:hypothetical protein